MSEIDDLKREIQELKSLFTKSKPADEQPKEWPEGLKEKYSKLLSAPQPE